MLYLNFIKKRINIIFNKPMTQLELEWENINQECDGEYTDPDWGNCVEALSINDEDF